MAISVNWVTGVILVPKADTVLIGTDPITSREIRTFDTEQFHKDLRVEEESEDGRPGFPITHSYESQTIIDGVSFAAKMLINSYYTVEFEDGSYRVVLQNTNNNIATQAVINQVSIQPTNSAGLVGSDAINKQSFLFGRVWIDTLHGIPGTTFPTGTASQTVSNYDDAYAISVINGLQNFNLESQTGLVLTPTQVIEGTHWYGYSPESSSLTLDGTLSNNACTFDKITITGNSNGRSSYSDCVLANLTNANIYAEGCLFSGTITLDSTVTELQTIKNGISNVPGVNKAVFDCNNANCDVQNRGWIGGWEVRNFTQGNNMSIDVLSGSIRIDSSCTAGTIVLRGKFELIDDSGPGCTVVLQPDESLEEVNQWARKASDNAEQANLKLG